MSGADALRLAAVLIETWADALPQAPWTLSRTYLTQADMEAGENLYAHGIWGDDGEEPVGGAFAMEGARWIKAWSPGLGRLIAEFLRDLADDAEEVPADMRAVALAEVIIVALGDPLPRSE